MRREVIQNMCFCIKQDGQESGGQNVKFYVSASGNLLFFNEPIDMTKEIPKQEETQTQQNQNTGAPKSDRPVVNLFVMSYCPYGLQMEKAMIPVMELLGDKVDFNIDYAHYIMHGKKEIDQNTRQHCIEKEQPDKFVAYLRCFVQSDDHEKCMKEAGVDSVKLAACVAAEDEKYNITGLYNDKSTWSSGRFPPYMVDAALANKYGVRGSPTLIINGKTVSVNRSPEAVKEAICNAFTTQPEECSEKLSTQAEGPGIGALGSGSDSTSSGGCGA